jgi:hypothetical protein
MLGLWVWLAATAPDASKAAVCELEITGMPVSVMRHHRVVVGADDERPLASVVLLELGDEGLQVRVLGPRYRGDRWVSRRECEAQGRMVMQVEPLPAKVVFACPPAGLTVACPGCPGEAGTRVYLAEDLPAIAMDAWSREVELLLRAPGYHRQERRLVLHPGPNSVHVELEPL